MAKTKMDYVVKINEDYNGTGESYIEITLNGGLNSAIPLTSPFLAKEKAEKLEEINLYKTSATGLELLEN